MNRFPFATLLLFLAVLGSADRARAETRVQEAIINAPVQEVWRLFTTSDGLTSWMVARADIDLRIGGLMRTRYAADGPLGDEKTIVNRILSYEPERMLSLQVHAPPADFPWKDKIGGMWTVLYFQPLEPGMTNVRIVGMGFGEDEASLKMREFFKEGNGWTLEQLQKKFWPTCASCKKEE